MIPPGTLLGRTQVTLDNGPTVGQVDPDGRLIHLAKLDGWWDPPATTGTKVQRPNDHGAYYGPAYYTDRVITLEARIDGFGQADSKATADRLIRALSLDVLVTLVVAETAETLQSLVRQEGDPLLSLKGNRATVSLSMAAPDPRRYAPSLTAEVGLPVTNGGLSLPLVLPLSLGATVSSGMLQLTNSGDIESYPTFTVRGPCAPFTITDGYGRQLSYAGSLAAGRTLVLDTANRVALADGVATRPVSGTWPRLERGNNVFYFNASTYDAASRLLVTYSPTARR